MSELKRRQLYRGHIPFVRFLLACIIGAVLASAIVPDQKIHRVLEAVTLWGTGAGGMGYWIFARRSVSTTTGILFFCFLTAFTWKRTWDAHPKIDHRHYSHYSADFLTGYFVEEPTVREHSIRGMMRVTAVLDSVATRGAQSCSGLLQVTIERDLVREASHPVPSYGSRFLIPADYQRIPPPSNPGEMDLATHFAKRDCWHQAYVRDADHVVLSGQSGSALISYALALRQKMVEKFGRYVPDHRAFSIASTLILGYRADLSRELRETYSETGTIHILSVSGMHVVIVFWLLARLLFWMDWRPGLKRLRFPLLMAAIWGYALLTGFSPSVLRAALMLSFILGAEASNRRSRAYNSMGASAFFLVLYQPKLLMNIGFQLSYLAVLGIVFLSPFLSQLLRTRWRWLRPISDYSAMSIAAQSGAFPLAMYYFQQFPVYFLLANLVVVLPASAVMYLGFALLLLPEVPVTANGLDVLGRLLNALILGMNEVLMWIQALPGASLTGLRISLWQTGLIFATIFLAAWSVMQRSGRSLIAALGICVVLLGAGVVQSWTHWNQRRFVIHQLRSSLAISLTGRGEALLYTDLVDLDDNRLRFSVLPYFQASGLFDRIQLVHTDEVVETDRLFVGHGLIQVGGARLLIYDGDRPPVPEPFPVDVLLIRQNPQAPLATLLAQFPCRKVVIDGSNHPKTIDRLQKEIHQLGIEHYLLKNNFAYVWVLRDDHDDE